MTNDGTPPVSRKRDVVVRRMGDIALGSVLLFVCLPALAIASFAVWFEGVGSPFLRQERLTRDGRAVGILKLRTTRATGITRTGAFLRRSHIDHLPLLFNVLKGDISLMGPLFADGKTSLFMPRER
jgi:lipopolysaccharide/colanic/teichoic acid biosynthesis glycosyltransferase